LDIPWAGVTLKNLLGEAKQGPGTVSTLLKSSGEIRSALRLSGETRLLAVLNGKDFQLEAFWGMRRKVLYDCLRELGFAGITGPTFSITSEFDADPITPASHNVLMLERHHQVIGELVQCTEATVVPNVYWRTDRERSQWAEWLNANPGISIISRDFSVTKRGRPFHRELEGLMRILEATNRPLHVLLPGVGASKAEPALRRLAEQECTGSIVTGDPILAAINGGNRLVFRDRRSPWRGKDESLGRRKLALANLQAMEEHLAYVVDDLPVYHASEGDTPVSQSPVGPPSTERMSEDRRHRQMARPNETEASVEND
jgi:hypothetical protein